MTNEKTQTTIQSDLTERLKKAEAIAANELTNSPGTVLMLQSAINEFIKGVEENKQQCDAKAYMICNMLIKSREGGRWQHLMKHNKIF